MCSKGKLICYIDDTSEEGMVVAPPAEDPPRWIRMDNKTVKFVDDITGRSRENILHARSRDREGTEETMGARSASCL